MVFQTVVPDAVSPINRGAEAVENKGAFNGSTPFPVLEQEGKSCATVREDISRGHWMSGVLALNQLLAKRVHTGHSYLEFLRVGAMSAGVYALPAGGTDPQKPHSEDEIYYVVRGKAKIRMGIEIRSISDGSVIFGEARLEHRFFDIDEDLALLVIFAPAESL